MPVNIIKNVFRIKNSFLCVFKRILIEKPKFDSLIAACLKKLAYGRKTML